MIEKRKSAIKKIKATTEEETQPEIIQPAEEVTPAPVPTPAIESPVSTEPHPKPKPLTMASLKAEVDELHSLIQTLTTQMTDVQSQLTLKRKPTNSSRIRIRDKQTGKIYKSKNNVYQSMLKAGELKDLVDKGIFGDVPEKNTFGVYALLRAYPGRFQEIHETEQIPS